MPPKTHSLTLALATLATLLMSQSVGHAQPAQIQGMLGAKAACHQIDSSWAPQWSNLKGYWRLNEANGAASVTESSTTGATGSVVNGDGWFGGLGQLSSAYNTGSAGYIDLGSNAAIKPSALPITVSAWVKPSAVPTTAANIFSSDRFDVTNYCGVNLTYEPSYQLTANIGDCGGASKKRKTTTALTPLINVGEWTHVVVVFGAVFGTFNVYINGVETTNLNPSNTGAVAMANGGSNGFIGGAVSTRHFVGYIDEVAIWDVALTAAEARKLYDQQLCPGVQNSPTSQAIYLTSTSATSWVVPYDWNNASNFIEVIGGGGGGGSAESVSAGQGGGGGAYSKKLNAILTPGSTVTIKVPAAGTGGANGANGTSGGDAYLCDTNSNCASITGTSVIVGAKGGTGGNGNAAGAAGVGGAAASGVGDTKYSGGNGGATVAAPRSGSAGGGAAGRYGAGGNGGKYGSTSASTAGGPGGGGNGGGGNGVDSGAGNANGGNGGTAQDGTAGGVGSTSTATAGTHGSSGSGGGGGSGTTNASATNGGNGGAGVDLGGTFGSGGGGAGGAGATSGGAARTGGSGGLYGGGGGGGGANGGPKTGAAGAQGIIAINYTPRTSTSTGPYLVQEAEIDWTSNAWFRATSNFDVKAGDILVAYSVNGDNGVNTIAEGSVPWLLQNEFATSGYTYMKVWTAVVDIDKTMSVMFSTNSGYFGGNVLTFRNSSGLGTTAKSNSTNALPSLTMSTSASNSALVFAIGDWSAKAITSRAWTTTVGTLVDVSSSFLSGEYTHFGGYVPLVPAAGSVTVAMTAPTSQTYAMIGLEVMGPDTSTPTTSCATIGNKCPDGTIYAGVTPDGSVAMYTTPYDAGSLYWNSGNSTNTVNHSQTSAVTGEANTTVLAAADSDTGNGGTQPNAAALYCLNLTLYGKSDWYLPSKNELNVLYTNRVAIGNFNTTGGEYGGSWYWSSTEVNSTDASLQKFESGTQAGWNKSYEKAIRCVRK